MQKILLATSISILLSACGGGGGGSSSPTPSPTPSEDKVGEISGVSGLGYKTFSAENVETGSGVLNQNSEYTFNDNETVTLYLGSAEIASATAEASMTLADFFPNLPATAKDFRAQLRMPGYTTERLQATSRTPAMYSQTTSNELHQTSNIMQLIIALDNDNDSSNGFDLLTNDWYTKLASETNASLNLDSNLYDFDQSHAMMNFQNTYNTSLNMDTSEPLAALYSSIGKQIMAHRRSGFTTPNVSPAKTGSYEYDAQQRLNKDTQVNSNTAVIDYTYDAKGNVLTINKNVDLGNNGTIEDYSRTTITYNSFGKSLTYTSDTDSNSTDDGNRQTYTEFEYLDDRVFFSKSLKKEHYLGDSGFDYFNLYTYTYNSNNLITENLSASVNEAGLLPEYSSIYEYKYNASNQVTQQIKKSKFTDNIPATTAVSDFSYAGNTVSMATENGNYEEVITETFNDAGQIIKKTRIEHTNGNKDGEGDVTYTYDNSGRIASCITKTDRAANGTWRGDKSILTYNDKGITAHDMQYDIDFDGIYEGGDGPSTATYGDDGELLTESSYGKEFEYEVDTITDGVRYLIHEYLGTDKTVANFKKGSNLCFLDV